MPKAKMKVSPTLPDSRPLPSANQLPTRLTPRPESNTPGLPGATKKLRNTTHSIPR